MSDYENDPSNDDFDSPRSKKKGGSALPWFLFFLVLLAAGGAGYFGFQMLTDEQAKAAAAVSASNDAAGKLKALEAEKAGLDAAKASLEQRVSALEADKGNLENEVKDKDEKLAQLQATYDSLQDKMHDEINKGEISLTQTGNRIQVDMVDKILFDSGHAELSDRGSEVLARVGGVLAQVDDKTIQVSGHTDDAPPTKSLQSTFPTNWELSAARAVNVVRFLTEKAHVPAKRLVAAGYGQFHPISTNANPEGRARNRRIEIVLTPALDLKPAPALEGKATSSMVSAKGSSHGKVVAAKATKKSASSKKKHR